ncbi:MULTISPECIES: septum formation initiator family protein [Acinetobacter]|jgi:Septum formation initiator|uniref:Cell division protein FtsB n=1 Tax=Acinetobacter amyesii TaxID=2942470 RepID=A0A1T1H5H3_9GAMM|nr:MULTISPECIES: septum formation initiator family protein [Acinetobacter]MCL6231446.1 septum formation initiator family protein [Acinetobacter amyesii]MCL6238955.1 septum formation initiator family protein [Acinetobacter amyesii]MCL6248479.1 septum formation initiator family protein [Acinetobacter amyesii]OOV85108.1 cell division protein FtsB [Acinetobacter amyesii]UIJ77080.1 septum formation initiator family protein [Acinetobacter sp. SH20PTE14]
MLNVFDSKASKALLGLAIFLIAGFQYLYWFGEGGYHQHQQLSQKIQQQVELNDELKERNRVLAAEVYDLKNGVEAIEEHARLDLGLIKPHETFVQMSTISTQYKPIYIDPNAKVDLRTNESEPAELPPEP